MLLKPRHLVPLFSFIFQKGKCTNCKTKLSYLYPFSEAITGLALAYSAYRAQFFYAYIRPENTILFFYFFIVFCFFIVLFLTDLKFQLIPNVIVYSAIVFIASFILISQVYSLMGVHNKLVADEIGQFLIQGGYMQIPLRHVFKNITILLVSSVLITGFFQFLVYITRGKGMGGGDVKLALLIGLFNGFPIDSAFFRTRSFMFFDFEDILQNILAVFLGFLFGAGFSAVLMLLGKKKMKDTIAFGPFLIIGSVVALLWGKVLIRAYLSLNFG